MKPAGSFSTASSAGVLLALVLGTGAAHSLPCIACDLATSYHAVVRVYDKAHTWGVIARWWIDPEYARPLRVQQPSDDLCEMRSPSADAR